MNRLLKTINSLSKKFGYRLIPLETTEWKDNFVGISKFEEKILNICLKYSMTSVDNMYFLIKAVEHIKNNKIKGDLVECGVWKGGNLILFQKLIEKFTMNKKIFAYDTFEGMPEPTNFDISFNNQEAKEIIKKLSKKRWKRKKIDIMHINL